MSSVTSTAEGGSRPLRRDAERNRQLVLDAARQVFAVRGLEAGFDEIARVAGVGASAGVGETLAFCWLLAGGGGGKR